MDPLQVQLLHETYFDFMPATRAPIDPFVETRTIRGRRQNRNRLTRFDRRELCQASALQRELVPRALPPTDAVGIHAWTRATGAIGGDLYDVFRIDDHRVGFWIVDATGHDLAAALLAALARGVLGAYARTARRHRRYDPLDAFALLNAELLRHEFADCAFVAAIGGTYHETTHALQWVRAGAPAPLRIDRTGRTTHLTGEGTVLGMIDDPPLKRTSRVLESGEAVSFFTDGLEQLPLDWARILRETTARVAAPRTDDAIAGILHELRRLDAFLDRAATREALPDDVTVVTFCTP